MVDAVEVRGLVVRRGGHVVLRDASFSVGAGIWLLRGHNGSGKSSLLRALAGVLPTHGGSARICGHDLKTDAARARAHLCYVPEDAELFGYLTAREFLETLATLRSSPVDAALALFEQLTHRAALATRIASLSAGQRRKLLLSTMRCGEPRVLLLDEPTNALDRAALLWLQEELSRWKADGRTAIVAMHADPLDIDWDGRLEVTEGRALHRADAVTSGLVLELDQSE